ncbi:hypothetical protein Bbelb_109190 [Branchiostoma belcheri]|nr:hypothetical protein Bbelb_109190 [Branchiostoma belcheri]
MDLPLRIEINGSTHVYNDELRFFKGELPAREFEDGQQRGFARVPGERTAWQSERPPALLFKRPPALLFKRPPALLFKRPPALLFKRPPALLFKRPPALLFKRPPALLFKRPPALLFNCSGVSLETLNLDT